MGKESETKAILNSIAIVLLATIVLFIGFKFSGFIVGDDNSDSYLNTGGESSLLLIRGDLDRDGDVDKNDIDSLVDYLYQGGQAPQPLELANIDGKGAIDISDLTYLIAYVYPSGSAPVPLKRGDVNNDRKIDAVDVDYIINYLLKDGPAPDPLEAGNVDGVLGIDIGDITYLVKYVYPTKPTLVPMLRGDANKDNVIDSKDVNYIIAYATLEGPAPNPIELGDVDASGNVDNADYTYLQNYLNSNKTNWLPKTMPTGDLVRDGIIDSKDVDYLAAYIGLEGPVPSPLQLANVDGVGSVDISDLSYLIRYVYPPRPSLEVMQRGDVNKDGAINQADITYLVAYLYEGGLAPVPLEVANVDGTGSIDISDLTYLIKYVYPSGPAPVAMPRQTGTTTCEDSDGGKDYYVKGVTYSSVGTSGEDSREVKINYYMPGSEILQTTIGVISKGTSTSCRVSAPWVCDTSELVVTEDSIKIGINNGAGQELEVRSVEIAGCGTIQIESYSLVDQGKFRVPSQEQFEAVIKCSGEDSRDGSKTDFCSDSDALVEYYCDSSNKLGNAKFLCPNGCEDGACLPPSRGLYCEALTDNSPLIQPKTRVEIDGKINYCDPFTLDYKEVKDKDSACVNDYECKSNVCIEGKCTLVRSELEKQTSLLKKIWCYIIHPIDSSAREECMVGG